MFLPLLRSLRPLNIYHVNLPKPRSVAFRPSPTVSYRTYARYSRFGDDERDPKGGEPNDPDEKEFRRRLENFKVYGTGAVVVGGGTIWYLTHLEQVPETKRWRYMDTSPRMRELLEKESYTQLMNEYGQFILPMNHRATRWVQAVAEKLLSKNGLGHVLTRTPTSADDQKPDEWLVYVVDQPIQNAFVMPGRKIVMFSGMLHQVSGEDQLAGILAHEVAHQLVGHVLERVSLTRLLVIIDIAIQFILGTHTNLAGVALQAFIGLPHSRTQELEADLIGLRLMSKACFDPEAVALFWKAFGKQDSEPPQFLSTHPGHKQRAKAIESWIPAVRAEYPCLEMVDFTHAYRQQSIHEKPSIIAEKQEPVRQPGPRRQTSRPTPVPSGPSPDSTDWDPWAKGSNGSGGGSGVDDWGGRDPWEEKNHGKKSSW